MATEDIAKLDCDSGECWIRINDILVCELWQKACAEAMVEGLNRLARAEDQRAKDLVAAVSEAQKPVQKKAESVKDDSGPKPKKRVKHRY